MPPSHQVLKTNNSEIKQKKCLTSLPQDLDISNWQPTPPKWEKATSVEDMYLKCEKFKKDTQDWGKNTFKSPFVVKNLKMFVYDSNAFEDAGVDEDATCLLVDKVLLQQDNEVSAKFNVSELEVVNHIKALEKASQMSTEELVTIDGLKAIHKVLMEGVLDSAGELRTCQACSSMYHQYPEPNDVPKLLVQVIDKYHNIEKSSCHDTTTFDIFTKAAWLKCQFLVVHPFEDGNGRLSRILVATLLAKSGLYILPSLSKNGHKRSKKHYINSLLKAAKGQSEGELAFFFLKCCYNIACEYEEFIHVQQKLIEHCCLI